MRGYVLWFGLLALSLGAKATAQGVDDFDDDFAQPVAPQAPPPRPPSAAPPASQPAPVAPPTPATPISPFDEPELDRAQPSQTPAGLATFEGELEGEVRVREARPALPAELATVQDDHPAHYYRDDSVPMEHATIESGLVGGVHLVDGSSGPPRTFRVSLTGKLFKKDGFIYAGDEHRRLSSTLAIGVTPIEHLELGASISGTASENLFAEPTLVQALGDTTFSAKGYGSPVPGFSLAGDIELFLLNGTGGIGYARNATSVALRGAASYDLRKTALNKPVVFRANLRYLFDNSSRLIRDVEAERYASLNDPAPEHDEYRHLVTAVERYQLGVNRVDTLTIGLGAEFPLKFSVRNFDLRPIIEWRYAVPVNRQAYDCLVSADASDTDGCLAREGFSARASNLTLAVRSEPGIRGLGVLLGVDIATGGHTNFTRELAPNSSYELFGALSYAYDFRPPRPVVLVREVEVEKPPAPKGRIAGVVIDKEGAQPIARAILHVEGSPISDLASNDDGTFTTYELDPGMYGLRVSHPDYHEALCVAKLGEVERVASVRCELAPLPRFGGLRGSVTTPEGGPVVGAIIELRGPTGRTIHADATGTFEARDLTPGHYEARVEAPGYLMRSADIDVVAKQDATLSMVLVPEPKERLTELKTQKITIKRQVQFVQDSAEISGKSSALIAEIADLLIRNPQVKRVEVQGHTDVTGSAEYNQELSQARAEAVRNALIAHGVEPERLTAVGYGRSRPLVPNITEANRARNRRVEFVILETAGAESK